MMQSFPFLEKRTYPRFPVNVPLSYTDANSNNTRYAQTHDISAQGLCIVTNEELPVGGCLGICFQMMDNGEQIYRRGKVIWSGSADYNKYKIGVQLEQPNLKPISMVLRTIKSQRRY
jgi:N-acetyl-anhydromuramyl-L-alanine amidase AmpD